MGRGDSVNCNLRDGFHFLAAGLLPGFDSFSGETIGLLEVLLGLGVEGFLNGKIVGTKPGWDS